MSDTATFTIKRGDLLPLLVVELTDAGAAVDLTGCTVVLQARDTAGAVVINAPMTILSPATAGRVAYAWQTADTQTARGLDAEIVVTDSLSRPRTFPASGFLSINVAEDIS